MIIGTAGQFLLSGRFSRFFCSHALESEYRIHELANQAGHRSAQTTLKYTNPTQRRMKEKADQL